MRNLFASQAHSLPFEIKCLVCDEWQPASEIYKLETYKTRYLVCAICGTEVEDGETPSVNVDEVLGYKALYEAQKEDVKFYHSEESLP